MAKPYSEDLRRRVVEAIESDMTIPEAAEQCGVSISSVVRFLKLHRETGSIRPAKFGGYKDFALAAHEDLVRQWVTEQPDITLAELEDRLAKKKIVVGKSSISRFLHHLKLPFKKPSRTASACGRRNGRGLSSWRKGAADGFLVAGYPVKKHGPWVVAHVRVVTPSGDPV